MSERAWRAQFKRFDGAGLTVEAFYQREGLSRSGATAVAALVIVSGLGVAFETDSPAGATIVLCAAALYLAALGLEWLTHWLRHRRTGRQTRARTESRPQ